MNNIGKNSFDIGYMDTLAAGDTSLHRLDPRTKLITTVMFIITAASFDKYALSALIPFFVYPVVLISLGSLPYRYLIKKVLIVSPFAVLVGIFNPLIDRQIFIQFGSIGISCGWVSFMSILARFVLTATAALILISLTGFNAVCWALIKFGAPRPLVFQLLFFYRYIFVLNDEAERMVRAGSLRTFNSSRIAFKTFASLTGNLLIRTLDRAQRIYLAMCSRGFDGNIRIIRSTKIRFRDIIFICGWLLVFLLLRRFDLSLILGKLVTEIIR